MSSPRLRLLVMVVVPLLCILAAAAHPTPVGAAVTRGPLGTNLGAVNYYDGTVPFADLMDQASEWVSQRTGGGWGSGGALALRRDGWPSSLRAGQFATAVLADVHYPSGTYTVLWSGRGTFDINGRRFGSLASAGGTGTIRLDGSSTVLLNLRSTEPNDPIRSIGVRVPGESRTAVFRSAYLRQLAPYRVLRFMDWQRTNSTDADPRRTFTCLDRTLPSSASQGTSAGVSIERMVDLANRVDADPWFTIPHEASIEWVRCHARIVAARLEPGLTPRYEFSNETWNPQFRAYGALEAEGMAAGLGDGDGFLALQQRHAQRHVAAMNAIGPIFDAAGRTVIRVLSGQAANAWVLDQRLGSAGAAAVTDEIAIAPYVHVAGRNLFDPVDAAEVATWSRSQLFAALDVALTGEVDGWIRDHVALAATWKRRLVTYEGGQHLAGDTADDALTTLLTGVNRGGRMETMYLKYLDLWRRLSRGSLFMHFTDVGPATRYGSWGALETAEQSTSPKYAALVAYSDRGR